MEELLIFPFNSTALEALGCIGKQFHFLGFIDDVKEKQGKNPLGFEVFNREAFTKFKNAKVLAVPGGPSTFREKANNITSLKLEKERFVTIIHPSAIISDLSIIGKNTLIMAGVVITSNAKIGDHNVILPNTVIHHDVTVGDYNFIGANVVVSGTCCIGKNCFIGSGSNISNNINIANGTLVGIGTTLLKSTTEGQPVVGNPGKPI
jgi:sugar O-acyltransferase (sialic acid O-acetyltransferase NeuD family)